MASIDRYRSREGYQPPSLPSSSSAKQSGPQPPYATERQSHSPSVTRRPDGPSHTHASAPAPNSTTSTLVSPKLPHGQVGASPAATLSPRKPKPAPPSPAPPASQPPFASQWYYTEEELKSTPSVLDGLSPAEERTRRAKGVSFIYQAGLMIQPQPLPQVTLFVAAVFFHRFYMRISMVTEKAGIHHYNIAATALFLANKTEENCYKTKNIIIAVAKVAQKNPDYIIDEQSKEYWKWRDNILTYEELMLETLTFDLLVPNPYDHTWMQLRKLKKSESKPIREAAWTFLNDSAFTSLPLMLDGRDIASAAIFFATVATHETIPDIGGQPWWLHLRADEGRITRAVLTMVAYYTENPLKKQNHNLVGSPVFRLEKTRRAEELSQLQSSQLVSQMDSSVRNNSSSNSNTTTTNNTHPSGIAPMNLDGSQQSQNQDNNSQQILDAPAYTPTNGNSNGTGSMSPEKKRKPEGSVAPGEDLDRDTKRLRP